ncbi:hypothetical protein AB0O28_20350 [Microbispora sp. NPDC088329]|uniref:hypothetical protein n=1 Tax=Microbispora sp. NPDC088329 TaxID=3154869 RepID=UPI00341B61D7
MRQLPNEPAARIASRANVAASAECLPGFSAVASLPASITRPKESATSSPEAMDLP